MIGVWARNLLITVSAVLLVAAGLYLCFVTPHHSSAPPESAVGLLDRADTLAWVTAGLTRDLYTRRPRRRS
jgi:hypothetical protein